MFSIRFTKTLLPAVLSSAFALCVTAAPRISQDPQESPQPDNTKKNLPTKHRDANRADQQGQSTSDTDTTKKIRQSLTHDKSLSTYAHNIKIITRNGMVELKGPVKSQEEKDAIGAKATEIAGASNVKNDLTVKTE
ncbi:MAG TPA: BON domain-containing protein [Candidatus Acidoferrum sp.]